MTRYSATASAIAPHAVVEIRGVAEAAQRVMTAAGLAAPSKPNVARMSGDAAVLWLGPKRWLVLGPRAREDDLAGALESAVAREPLAAAANVSDMFAGVALRGLGAGEILAQGTPLDFDALAPDAATMTDLFMIPAVIRRAQGGYDIWIDRSLSQYLDECLRVANGNEG